MAGESARARADALQRVSEAYRRGAQGEQTTADALAVLPTAEWIVLHDRAWPGRARANIDHVVVGPPGVFVIDSKNWTGDVRVDRGVLRQNGRARTSAITGAESAAGAVRALLPGPARGQVHAVISLTTGSMCARSGAVLVCSSDLLLATVRNHSPAFSSDEVAYVGSLLARELRPATDHRPAPRPAPRVTSRPRASAGSNARRPRRRPGGRLLGPALALAVAAGLATNPAVVSSVGERVGDLWTDRVTQTTEQQTDPTDDSGPRRAPNRGKRGRLSPGR